MISITVWLMLQPTFAHIVMRQPIPANDPTTDPLLYTGGDFPCKASGGSFDVSNGYENVIAIDADFDLTFQGSATHGGGSCQVSLASGWSGSSSTKFSVIHSIEGGCPAFNPVDENLSTDPVNGPKNTVGLSAYKVRIPAHPALGPGAYTLAWTWNNKIGNREQYMNCARVTLTGSSIRTNMTLRELPDMFVANIGPGCTVSDGCTPDGCTTSIGGEVQYPAPGDSVEVYPQAKLVVPQGSACGPASPAISSTITNPVSVVTGYDVLRHTVIDGDETASTDPVVTSLSTTKIIATTTPLFKNSSSTVGTPSAATLASCVEGAWWCDIDGKSFKRCAEGLWSTSIAMPLTTWCEPGIANDLTIVA